MYAESSREPDDEKFGELILFIAERSEGDHRFGATKLNKELFYADFFAFLQFGRAITWQPYQKLKHGPAPRRLLPVLNGLKDTGATAEKTRNYYGREQKVTVALREPDISRFSAEEISLVTQIIDDCWNTDASGISNLSHEFLGWQLATEGEDIPYEVAVVAFDEESDADENITNALIGEVRARIGDIRG